MSLGAGNTDDDDDANVQKNRVLPAAASVQGVGGLIAVTVGVLAITALAIVTMALVHAGKDADVLIPLATSAFGVISTVVGAYLGIKIGTDQAKTLALDASKAHAQLAAYQARQGGSDVGPTATGQH